MAGILSKDRIIEQKAIEDALNSIGTKVSDLINKFDLVAASGAKLSQALGGADNLNKVLKGTKDVAKSTEELTFNQAELAKQHQELGKLTAKLEEIQSGYNKEIQKTKIAIKAESDAINESITGKKKLAQSAKELAASEKQAAIDAKKAAKDRELADKQAAQLKRLLISAQNTEKGSAQQLVAVNKILADRMKQLNVLTVEGAAKYKQLDAAMLRNKARILEMNQAAQQQGGMFKNLAQAIITYGAAYLSVQSVIQLGQSILNQTKELDKLDFSLKAVIKDSDELALTQSFLSNVATKYGADLLSISERYIKFRAAAIQANLSAIETQKIFDSVSKAAGVLGLKTDETAGIYLALEQMLSKGKVTTEELRRQLGERLPGAFGIMAKSLGVTLPMLDKMLKNGEIMSADVLPKFAKEIEKAYGIESTNKVETLTAATQRFSTAWTEMVRQMQASKPITWIMEWMTNQMTLISTGIDIVSNKGKNLLNIVQRIPFVSDKVLEQIKKFDALSMKEVEAENKRRKSIGEDGILWKQYYQQRITQEKLLAKEKGNIKEFDVDKYKTEIEARKKSYEDLAKLADENSRKEFQQKEGIFEKNYQAEIAAELKIIKAKERIAMDKVNKNPNDEAALFTYNGLTDARLYLEMEQFDAAKKDKKGAKGNQFTELEKLKEQHKQQIDEQEIFQQQLLASQVRSDEEIAMIDKDNQKELLLLRLQQIEEEKKAKGITVEQIALLESEAAETRKKLSATTTDYIINNDKRLAKEQEDAAKKISENYMSDVEHKINLEEERLNNEAALNIRKVANAKDATDQIRNIENNLSLAILKYRKQEYEAALLSNSLTVEDKKKYQEQIDNINVAIAQNSVDQAKQGTKEAGKLDKEKVRSIGEAVNEGFNFSQQIFANQADAAKKAYDEELKAAGDSVEGQIIAKRKYEAEDLKIRRKQAIADKLQAAFNIGLTLATATAKLNAFQIIAASLALATVLAKPLPAYADGVKSHKGGAALMGEEGIELVTEPDGNKWLTSPKPTVYDLAKGSSVLPADKTAQFLQDYAITQGASVFIDMTSTNKHLSQIAQNTKGRSEEKFDLNGNLIYRKRGNTTTHYATV